LEEGHSIKQFHGEEPILAIGDQLVECDQIGVCDAQECAKFVLEAQDRSGAGAVHHLEGDQAAALAVVRAEDSAHAAASEHVLNVVAFELGPV
jgi:hypothetical protein